MNSVGMQSEDRKLIQRTLDGNREAFGDLIRKYQDRLYNGMVHLVRSEAEAEDIVQEAFVLAMTRLDSFQGNSQFYTWLYRIAYNTAITRIRRRKPTVPLVSRDGEYRLELEDGGPGPEAGLHLAERAEILGRALERLSEEHRAILTMREIQELDYEAIAEILELPVGTVRSRLHRARSQLKAQLELLLGTS